MASSSPSRQNKTLLWEILEDEEGDDFLLGIEENDQRNRVMRPLCSDAERGRIFIHDMINGHPGRCHNMLRMWPEVFTKLCSNLENNYGLRDTCNMSAKEGVAIFLHMCGHNITQRTAMHTFGHSNETISRKFHEVLNAVVLMAIDMFAPDPTALTHVHPKLQSNWHYWPHFKGFVGAIDGTHVPVMVSGRDQRRYWNRHGDTTMNILAICDLDMMFTYIYVGIPGSAHDAKVLSLAIEGDPTFPHPPDGKYYLGDSGYALRRGYLCPYRGDRYHLDQFRNTPQERNYKEIFNRRHSSLRSVIERTFGVWKGKWRVVKDDARYQISTMRKIVVATMALHNFVRSTSLDDPDFQSEQEYVNEDSSNEEEHTNTAEQDLNSRQYMEGVRDEIANAMWVHR